MRLKQDDELLLYRRQIGDTKYRKQYLALYRFAQQSKHRHSGEEYENSEERLKQIKEKYKNGVSASVVNEMLGI